jgi:RNA polymerase primary sigma factor
MKSLVIDVQITKRDSETFHKYLKDVSNIKLLTIDEERELSKKAFTGDKKAMDELVIKNLRFVISAAKQYTTKTELLQDLINEGNIGLIEASKCFDPNKGFKFISYAVWHIRKNMLEFLTKNGKTIRIPNNKAQNMYKLKDKIRELEQRNFRSPDISELIKEFKGEMSENEVIMLDYLNEFNISSLDFVISQDDGGATLLDVTPDTSALPTDHLTDTNDIKDRINLMLKFLKPKERDILERSFGLNGFEQQQLEDIGKVYNINKESVRQAREKIFRKLKYRFKN